MPLVPAHTLRVGPHEVGGELAEGVRHRLREADTDQPVQRQQHRAELHPHLVVVLRAEPAQQRHHLSRGRGVRRRVTAPQLEAPQGCFLVTLRNTQGGETSV